MTKKEYALIASAFRQFNEDEGDSREVRLFATVLACKLEEENPRFDKLKFMQACGYAVL